MVGATEVKLNIGAGDVVIPGFTPIDRRLGTEAYPLDYPDNSVSEIRASHVLEHFGFYEVPKVLAEWVRVLEPGGVIKISVPDWEKIKSMETTDPKWFLYLMGGQTDENDYHKSIFTRDVLEHIMANAGLVDIYGWHSDNTDTASHPVSLNLQGVKPCDMRHTGSPKSHGENVRVTKREDGSNKIEVGRNAIAACISMPRLTFTDHIFCAIAAFRDRNIPITKASGAFWGQCLERIMMSTIQENPDCEWIVTMDYDTLFTPAHFDRLCELMATHPEADCIAPVQMKRETDAPLLWDCDASGNPKTEWLYADFEDDLTRVRHAHFGLTLFRVEALRRMSHPWFWGQPNKDGEWGEGRQDDDIYFWEKWAEVGNTLYIANRVPIGHIQFVATWPGEDFKPLFQYVGDFNQHGPPEGIRGYKEAAHGAG